MANKRLRYQPSLGIKAEDKINNANVIAIIHNNALAIIINVNVVAYTKEKALAQQSDRQSRTPIMKQEKAFAWYNNHLNGVTALDKKVTTLEQ